MRNISQPAQPVTPPGATSEPIPSELRSVIEKVEYPQLPMSQALEGELYYVRESYPVYYEYIVTLLYSAKKNIITLSGTPGIGKSVFYLYFFQRYRKENPNATIVTACFTETRVLVECRVFKAGEIESEKHPTIPEIPGALYLYDGPPDYPPPRMKMVCFTSPNAGWFKAAQKQNYAIRLFFPVWTLQELKEANALLELGIDDDVIEQRYSLFGGSARTCLRTYAAGYRDDCFTLDTTISNVTSYSIISNILKKKAAPQIIGNIIFRYIPVPGNLTTLPILFDLDFCSPLVAAKVDSEIQDKSYERRCEMMNSINGISESATFFGWLFEKYVVRMLKTPKSRQLTLLQPRPPAATLATAPVSEITLDFLENGFEGAPKTNYESIDGWYRDPTSDKLFLFQITKSANHPVKANGIIPHLKRPDMAAYASLDKVVLVFVVPDQMTGFSKQAIVARDGGDGMGTDISRVDGIGAGSIDALRPWGIRTVQQLVDALDANPTDPVLSKFKGRLDKFKEKIGNEPHWTFIPDIPQYVLKIAEDEDRPSPQPQISIQTPPAVITPQPQQLPANPSADAATQTDLCFPPQEQSTFTTVPTSLQPVSSRPIQPLAATPSSIQAPPRKNPRRK